MEVSIELVEEISGAVVKVVEDPVVDEDVATFVVDVGVLDVIVVGVNTEVVLIVVEEI